MNDPVPNRKTEVNSQIMDAKEAAMFLGSNYWSVIALARKNLLPHYRVGRKIIFRRTTLEKWVLAEEARSTHNAAVDMQGEEFANRA